MVNDFYDNDLEKFLQEQTAKHKMFPSDKIWRNIDKQLHGKKQWPGLTVMTLFIVAAITVTTIFLQYNTAVDFGAAPSQQTTAATAQQTPELIYDINAPNPQNATVKKAVQASTPPSIKTINGKQNNTNTNNISATSPINTGITINKKYNSAGADEYVAVNRTIANADDNTSVTSLISNTTKELNNATETQFSQRAVTTGKIVNNVLLQPKTGSAQQAILILNNKATQSQMLTVATFKPKPKWHYEIYMAPSVSYRRLVEETIDKSTGAIVSRNSREINKLVNQKPAMGFEFGFTGSYAVNNRFKIVAGIQLNSRKYQAPAYYENLRPATVQLVNGNGVDSFMAFTNYSVSEGTIQTTIVNSFYQISAPVGVEWSLTNNQKFNIALAATLQPTYTLSQNAYVLSADQKQYVDGNPLLRKWNMNSSVGAVLSFNNGTTTWLLGPQIRYQNLPNYKTPYPIKEYLLDYGLKIGVRKAF